MAAIRVTHSTGSYEVHVAPGLVNEAAARIGAALPGRRLAVVTDPDIQQALAGAGRWPALDAEVITVPPGEGSKSRAEWGRITDHLLDLGLGRDSALVAVGGGSIGDLTGFVAATYLRGVPVVQIPTTLLAMVDASVGGKVGLDTPAGKNLVGAFHPPALVLCDPTLVATLPGAIYKEGFAEGVKHGVVADAEYFQWIVANAAKLIARDPAALEHFVRRSVEIKAGVVSRDELETGERAILNAGHTVGHALETQSGFTMRHGDAVALGLVAEARIAEALGVAEEGLSELIALAFALLESGASAAPRLDRAELWDLMKRDKKNRAGRIRMALPRKLGAMARDGAAWTIAVDPGRFLGGLPG
ncbi:MAG TPA: 3-dehydroquinate synthase [Gemmatimonadales bacterium]|nr:3-dehydroquinate synthase [Gemmatimonadales bacterium]